MKKLALLFVFVNSLIFAQGEQRYADGTATDQDGNSFEWISYGYGENSFHWAIENADVVTYNDGTPIPQVLYPTEWANLTSGAWCYYNNDPSQHRLYNWYAVNNPKFAPEGWRVASKDDYTLLTDYLFNNNYIIGGGVGKAMASTTGWNSSTTAGAPGNDQNLNNSSGFNAFPEAHRLETGPFANMGNTANFWTSTPVNTYPPRAHFFGISYDYFVAGAHGSKSVNEGISVRFVRDAPNDTEPPVFTLLGDNPISVNQGDTYTDPGVTATDNVDGDLTSSIVVSGTVDTSTPGTYIVTYSVTDSAGNTSTVTRTVIVLDTQPPIITILGANPINVNQGATYTDPGANAIDNVDGNLTSSIVVSGTVDTSTPGTYIINYNVTDSAGNEAIQATRIVEVVETTPTVDAGSNQTICEGNSVTIYGASASNISSFAWATSGDGVFDNPSIINPTYIPGPVDILEGVVYLGITANGTNGQQVSDVVYITIEQDHIIQLTSSNSDQIVEENNPISLITFSIGGGATSVTVYGLPTGISLTVVDGGVTISGTPTDDITTPVTYTYTVTTTGNGCTAATYTGTITVNPAEINPTEADILLNGIVSAENNQIKNVAAPTEAQDAATKAYADAIVASQGLMNFNEWDNYQVWNDNTTVNLMPNSFVFLNADNTTLVLPDNPENCCFGDVIYIYVMRNANSARPTTLKSNNLVIRDRDGNQASSGQSLTGVFQGGGGLQMIVNVGDYWMAGSFLKTQ